MFSPIHLKLMPSRSATVFFLLLNASAIGVLFWMPLPIFASILLSVYIIIAGKRVIACHGLRSAPNAISYLHQMPNQRWLLQQQNGVRLPAVLKGEHYLSSWVVILSFRLILTNKPHAVLVFVDAVPKDFFRHLQTHLRFFT